MKRLALILFLILAAQATEPAQRLAAIRADFQQAVELALYRPEPARSAFRACALALEQLRQDLGTVHPQFDATLGAVWTLAGEPAPAILALRQAQRALPHDPHLAANLAEARSLRVDALPDTFVPLWVERLALQAWPGWVPTTIFLAGWLLVWLATALQRRGTWSMLIAVGLVVVGGLPLAARQASDHLGSNGVITAATATLRTGDGFIYPPATIAPLHAGTEVRQLRQRAGWIEVRLSDGQTGWLPTAAIASIP